MNVACARGCGHTVPVSKEDLDEMLSAGTDIVVSHEVCPTDPDAPKRRFRITTSVYEVFGTPGMPDDKLAGMGDTVEGVNFTESAERLGVALQGQWERIVGLADTIDLPVEDPNPPQADAPPVGYGRCKGCGVQEPLEVLRQMNGYHSSECERDNNEKE